MWSESKIYSYLLEILNSGMSCRGWVNNILVFGYLILLVIGCPDLGLSVVYKNFVPPVLDWIFIRELWTVFKFSNPMLD